MMMGQERTSSFRQLPEQSDRQLIRQLKATHHLSPRGYKALLEDSSPENCELLRAEAQETAISSFGRNIYIRGLIEISNHCRNNCLYCGIRAENRNIRRYRLSKEEIMECCRSGYSAGFRTFVLQGGEDPVQTDAWVEDVVRSIRAEFPDCAITLSLGEKSGESYSRFRAAGADRYLLRHETFNPAHYSQLHPDTMSRENRLGCLAALKALGYQTGSGFMVGSPYQDADDIVEDILFIEKLHPEMIGIGPFIHHKDTPLGTWPDGSVSLTLKLISIFRLMDPRALIPATTSLATLEAGARLKGILAGANVVMPNLTPAARRSDYSLYEGKTASGAESAEGLELLKQELSTIGYGIAADRGDYIS